MANRVRYGLKNVHYAKVTETFSDITGKYESTYGDIKAWPGAVNLELSPEESTDPFYADDSVYVMVSNLSSYSGSFESAQIPDDVYLNILNYTKDETTGLVTETTDDKQEYIALMFEIDGDETKRRYIFYRCMIARPNVSAATTEDSKTPQTATVDITVSGRPEDGKIKAYADNGSTAYTNFFTTVQVSE